MKLDSKYFDSIRIARRGDPQVASPREPIRGSITVCSNPPQASPPEAPAAARPRKVTTALKAYAMLTSSASKGAVRVLPN